MKKILVFPCGTEIGLAIYRSFKYSSYFKIYGASSIPDHGRFVYQNYIEQIPFIDSDDFIVEINKIIDQYKIDILFPAHDSVVLKCAKFAEQLHCKILSSPLQTCEIARSKLLTYKFFHDKISVPEVYNLSNLPNKFPLFLKPEIGQGAKGCIKACNKQDIVNALKKDPSLLILEYLPGKEYTIDCFTDYSGNLVYCQGRERARILNGISANTFSVNNKYFKLIAEKINNSLPLRGAWFFQVKENSNGILSLLEFAPRIAGTMEFNRLQGVNLPLIWCFAALGYQVKILKNNYQIQLDRALSNSYKILLDYDEIYTDFDDCLVTNNSINYKIIAFLYKQINLGKKITLITKHDGQIAPTLKKYRISEIFDEIIHLKRSDNKYCFIKNTKSIFIDDSFAEREEVSKKLGINVFSPDMIDDLL